MGVPFLRLKKWNEMIHCMFISLHVREFGVVNELFAIRDRYNYHCCLVALDLVHRLEGRNIHYVPRDPLCPMDPLCSMDIYIRHLGISSVFN